MAKKLIFILLAAFVLRIAFVFSAYHGDLNNNISWGRSAVAHGLNGFYELKGWDYSAPNQPPLYILLFTFCVWIYGGIKNISWYLNNNLGLFPSSFIWFWEQKGMILLVKFPSILADLGIGYFIYRYFEKRKNNSLALKLSLLWLFNPVSWYNSAIWGQTDAIVNFIGLAAILLLLERKLVLSICFLVLSILFKGSLVLFTPILLVVALLQKHKTSQWVKAFVCSVLVVVLSSIWFHPSFDLPLWLFNLYNKRIFPGEIGYLTANAFNLWWLVDPGKTLDSAIYLGLPARIWGLITTGAGMIGLIYWLVRGKISDRKVFWTLATLSLITFLFMTRIHERYMYPFFPIGTILLGFVPGFALVYFSLSLSHLLNLYHLFWYPPLPALEAMYKIPQFPIVLSVINIVIFFFLLRHLKSSKI